MSEASNYIPAAPIFLPEGPWQQIPGEVTAAKGFKAAGMYGGLHAKGEKPELALVSCDVDATVAGQRINRVWMIDSTQEVVAFSACYDAPVYVL
ncbi:arginine biosynthesis bifunctional protein ArgJ [Populus alba x Populus x berolinensis]|nr:arginine biosynthesis bifunctional protein ArgJ [Populus alba x Populus x berolinensis]